MTITAAARTRCSDLMDKQWPVQLLEVLEWNELQFLLFAGDFYVRRTLNLEEHTHALIRLGSSAIKAELLV